MRRRRNAAASSEAESLDTTDAAVPNPAEPNTEAPPAPAAAAAEETPKPRRRTATRRKTAADTGVDATAVPQGEEAPAVAAPAVTGIAPPDQPVAVAAADQVAPPEPAAAEETPAAKPKRTTTRRRKATADVEAVSTETPAPVEAAPVAAAPLTAEETTVTPPADVNAVDVAVEGTEAVVAGEEAAAEGARTSRRRGGGRRRGGANVVPAPEVMAEAGDTAPAADQAAAPPTPEAADTGTTQRVRGVRRRTEAAPPPPATIAVPVIETPAPAEGEEGTGRKRVRGLRRAAPAAATVAEAAPPTAVPLPATATPSAPLPPIYQPLPAETLARLPEARIVVRKNVPELVINGEARLPLWFFVNTEDFDARDVAQREIRLAYEAGVRIFTILSHLPWRTRSGERRHDVLDEALQFVADNAPEALILPRLIFSPPASWERAHPEEMAAYADGETGDVSIASRAFWEGEAEEALRAAVEHVAEGPHAGRVWGFYLEHGEWFYEKGRGYDLSEANQQGFRAWLRSRYRNSAVALRAAWNDGSVTFETAAIPSQPVPSGPTLFFTPREQRYADFHEYASDITAQVITRLGRAVKQASGGRSAVAVSYGYTLELARSYSGHLALAQVLASPDVDILTGPVSYSGRTPGGSAPFPAPVESVTLAGKMWVSEDDTKTFLAAGDTPDSYNPKVSSLEGTWAAYSRNFGAALASGAGVSWMDLWGMGWLDDRELWQRLGGLRQIAEAVATRRREPDARPLPDPDVAVIVDERSFFDVRTDEATLGHLIAHQRDVLLRSGARAGFYLLSDLLKKEFPQGPKLLLFLNAFRLPEAVRNVIKERFQRDGRTLAWVYAPGGEEPNLAELSDTLGMQLRIQPWGSKMGTQVLSNARSPLTDALRGQRFGEETRVNPSYYVADPKAQPLGEYVATGNVSLAVRKHPRWQSVFIGEMQLPLPLLRGLYKMAGVPVFTVDDDVAWVGDNLICLHSAPGGGTTVYLPEEAVLYDVLNRETLASDGRGARLSMPPRGTRLLFYGTPAEVSRLGGDPNAAPPGLTASEMPPPPIAFAFEGGPGPSAEPEDYISPEDAALMEAALTGDFPLLDKEDIDDEELLAEVQAVAVVPTGRSPVATPTPPSEAGDDSANKKKRRRRRRRRGGADEADDLTENGEADADSTSDADGEEDEAETDETGTATPVSAPIAEAPSRSRPSLEELLPLSEAPDGADLPPIPEEFLPLDPSSVTPGGGEVGEEEAARSGGRRPTRRRSSSRRRGGAAETSTEGQDGAA
jgi:hypothetical protein